MTVPHPGANVWTWRREWAVIGGCVVWLVALIGLQPGWAAAMLLLAVLVVTPLGLGTVARISRGNGRAERLLRLAGWIQLPAALCLAGAVALPSGLWAALLSVPWLVTTFVVALGGLWRAAGRGFRSLAELAVDSGLVYLAVGGIWTTLSRAGARPMGFEDEIVLLTAVHFHYAGFVLPVIAGLVGRVTGGVAARLAAAGVVVGVPAVAAGIAFSPLVEWLAASLLAGACTLVAVLEVRLALQTPHSLARYLWLISGSSLVAAMILAGVYAAGEFFEVRWLSIPQMLPTHGALNALGFGVLGIVAWQVALGGGVAREPNCC